MNFLRSLFRFYIYSSIHVSIATCALVVCTFLEADLPFRTELLYLTFGITLVVYNAMKYATFSVRYHIPISTSMKAIQVLTIGCGLLALYYLVKLPLRIFWVLIPLGLLCAGYMLPLLPGKKSLRSIKGIKVFIIAVVWTGTTVLMPMLIAPTFHLDTVAILGTQRFLFIIIVMIPFEIRDLQHDALHLRTIPQLLGISKTKQLGGGLLLLFVSFSLFRSPMVTPSLFAILGVAIITGLFLWKTKRIQSHYFCSFGVESIAILWALLLGIFTY